MKKRIRWLAPSRKTYNNYLMGYSFYGCFQIVFVFFNFRFKGILFNSNVINTYDFCTGFLCFTDCQKMVGSIQFATMARFFGHLYRRHSIYIRTVSSYSLFSALLNWFNYRKVASRSTSRLVAHPSIFRMFMKEKFDAYVL